jgi:hypothetical protein
VAVDPLHHANARHVILCGLIRKPLRKIGVILLHDVEHCFLGEIAMV